jgi:multidrug transporter EmrE-like cation transporter
MWAGIGIVATALIGFVFFKESVTVMKIICIMLILLGTIGLNLLTNEK